MPRYLKMNHEQRSLTAIDCPAICNLLTPRFCTHNESNSMNRNRPAVMVLCSLWRSKKFWKIATRSPITERSQKDGHAVAGTIADLENHGPCL